MAPRSARSSLNVSSPRVSPWSSVATPWSPFRDHAADLFERHMGSAWRPRSGSKVNHRALTAAMIDSRDFLAAKRRVEIELLMPAGVKVAFAGGMGL